jgi:hypothetical protein
MAERKAEKPAFFFAPSHRRAQGRAAAAPQLAHQDPILPGRANALPFDKPGEETIIFPDAVDRVIR